MPVAGLVIRRRAPVEHAAAIDGFHRHHVIPGLAAVATRVHRERAADGAGHAGHPFGAGGAVLGDEARQVRRRHPGAGAKAELVALRGVRADAGEGVMGEDDRARKPRVAHEKVAAQADEEHRLGGIERAQELAQVGDVRGLVEHARAPAGSPAHVLRHRLVAPERSPQSHSPALAHVHRLSSAPP